MVGQVHKLYNCTTWFFDSVFKVCLQDKCRAIVEQMSNKKICQNGHTKIPYSRQNPFVSNLC